VALVYCLAIGFLMISTVPAWSGKTLGSRVRRDMVLPLFVLVALYFALLASYPWAVLATCSMIYLALLPVSALRYRRLMAAHRAEKAEGAIADGGSPMPSAAEPHARTD
jgi:CDP-diacylglycerol--serine O-phosphatidyltransferase